MSTRKLASAALGVAVLALTPAAAVADSTSGAEAMTLGVSCSGQPVTFLVQGLGIFATAKVLATGSTFVPTSFTLNGTVLQAKQGPGPPNQVTCTTVAPAGTLVITGFFVPPAG